ncbi:M48 family metallopeptidase [Tumebacillus flagellatus]|uniref:Peptidase M48 domain-containing protein n=1 Tax=Tumebacillus flagellatus TaxID=1157490 RepID=A0A074LQI7_9BACL|nr:M48 family metallopeptidase [Tumebacillus flagellatus]KEO82755.1 hypothetical protein EL26_13475 [Tumebacillus flagellatus]
MSQTATLPNALGNAQETRKECPECKAGLPHTPGYKSWCPSCNWNLADEEKREPANRFEKVMLQLGSKMSEGLFREVQGRASSLKRKFTPAKLLAYAIATVVHGVTLIFVAAAAWLYYVAVTEGMVSCYIWGTVVALLAWVSLPKWRKKPKKQHLLDRNEFSTLYKLVDDLADSMGTKRVDGLVFSHDYNAYFYSAGLGKKYIGVGVPLLSVLNGQEKVALLAHETAHGANGDSNRGFYVSQAYENLFTWAEMIYPVSLFGNGLLGVLLMPVLLLMRLFAYSLIWTGMGLVHLLFRDSQRAEYYADLLAMQQSGREAMESMLQKLFWTQTFQYTIHKCYFNKHEDLVSLLRSEVANIPDTEIERLRRLSLREDSRLDVTHPPSAYRIELMKSVESTPRIELSPDDERALEKELSALYAKTHNKWMDIVAEGWRVW